MKTPSFREPRVAVVGAGMGGLAAAIELAAAGFRVTLFERHAAPGGKMRELPVGAGIDSGPTVLTMRWVFEELAQRAGRDLYDLVTLETVDPLARHWWTDGSRLDLFADVERSAAAIREFAGARDADGYRRFAAETEKVFETLDASFMRRDRPGPIGLALSLGLAGIPRLVATRPFTSLWRELARYFGDPRLRQLFGRYATYCGSSPFAAPATLMLIAHAERAGVWRVRGGMQRLAEALADLAGTAGAELRCGAHVERIVTNGRRVTGIELDGGERIDADAVVFNGDVQALTRGLLGGDVRRAVPARRGEPRSLSAVTWSLACTTHSFPLDYHNVFFGDDYPDEFASIFSRRSVTATPTVYVCAQDRPFPPSAGACSEERLFLLMNAPPRPFQPEELDECRRRVEALLARCGLDLRLNGAGDAVVRTSPDDFAGRFPGSDGAIYGWPTHGWYGSFRRGRAESRVPGLWLAGGTVHPGPGVPMAALSGRIAAAAVRRELTGR